MNSPERLQYVRRIDALSNKLAEEGKVVQVSAKAVDEYAQAVDWSDRGKVRELLRGILGKHKGLSVQFKYGEQYATAYLTKDGINHAVVGPASKKKAAAFAVYCDLIRNAEYCFSSKNDPHSNKNKKIPGKIDWDYFVAVAQFGDDAYPVVFKIRTIDMDVRSQIYEIATTKETGGTHEGGQQQKQPDAHSDYGVAPISDGIVDEGNRNVNIKFSMRQPVEETKTLITMEAMLADGNIVEKLKNLDDPNMIVYQTERYDKNGNPLPNNVSVFVGYQEGGGEGLAVIEFDGSIDPTFVGREYGETAYHIVVTLFSPDTSRDGMPFDYAEELLSNPDNYELKIERRPPARGATREIHPNTSGELPSNNKLSHRGESVNSKFSLRQPAEETKTLIAMHNLTEEKLEKAIELGGFPIPSIAVTGADIPHTNFGEITLVMDKGTEVMAAVVPSGTSESLRSKLAESGVQVVEYESGNPQDRLEKVNGIEGAKFSERDPAAQELNRALEKENAAQAKENEYLRELVKLQGKVTNGTKFTRTSVRTLAKNLMQETGAKGDYLELSEILNGIYESIGGGKFEPERAVTRAEAAAMCGRLYDKLTK